VARRNMEHRPEWVSMKVPVHLVQAARVVRARLLEEGPPTGLAGVVRLDYRRVGLSQVLGLGLRALERAMDIEKAKEES